MKRPSILISNDDGYNAGGILALTEVAMQFGDVTVVAPDRPRSAQSSALTVAEPLRLIKIEEREGLCRYRCTGTPADCVKLGVHELFAEIKPDLVLSGVNHGLNTASSVHYSGTMGVVLEATMKGVQAMGFSLDCHKSDASFEASKPVIAKMIDHLLKNPLPMGTCLNVNIPYTDQIKGYKMTRQANGNWVNEYEKRVDPHHRDYFWLTGDLDTSNDSDPETDDSLVKAGYVAIVPVKIDLTDYDLLNGNWWKE